MSIYAKTSMDTVPESCAECGLGEKYGCVGDVKCKVLDEYFTGNTKPPHKERPDACPLAEFPTLPEPTSAINTVSVRWFDGCMEEFDATEVRFSSDLLFLRLADGKNRHIPLRQVRWFGMSKESHQEWNGKEEPAK